MKRLCGNSVKMGFPAKRGKSLSFLKHEALKAFQCASTMKADLKDTAMFAQVALADILEAVWRFTPLNMKKAKTP